MDMITVLYIIAGTASGLFFLRLTMMLFGFGDHHDLGAGPAHDLQDAADFKILTIQTAIVTMMMGGWVSLLLIQGMAWQYLPGLGLGTAVGFVTALGFGYVLFSMRKLEHDGTIREFKAEGLKGTCYLRVPEAGKGKGQVQIAVDNQQMTLDAISDGPAIESFKRVVVMARVDEKTLRVCETD